MRTLESNTVLLDGLVEALRRHTIGVRVDADELNRDTISLENSLDDIAQLTANTVA